MKNDSPNAKLLSLILRAQYVARQKDGANQGYAMLVVSVLSIFLLSLMSAYLTITNMGKSSTDAFVDGNNAFYVAEAGLNRRADKLRQKFTDTITPTAGSGSLPTSMSSCFPTTTTAAETDNDFECRSYGFTSSNNTATVKNTGSTAAVGGATETTSSNQNVNYTAYTYVSPKKDYATNPPDLTLIAAGEAYAGLYALEYQYNVYSTAKKNSLFAGDTNIVLQMGFKSRVVPLFQFAAFYEEDLEIDSQMPMSVTGPVHTNGNLRAISYGFVRANESPYGTPNALSTNFNAADLQYASTRLLNSVTVAGSVYDRIESSNWRPSWCSGSLTAATQTQNCGVMAVYKGSASDPTTDYNPANYTFFPDFAAIGRTTPLTSTELSPFGSKMLDGSGGVKRLSPPKPGFLRERNYKTGEVGTYYSKADMRLKFFPNRAMPFSFTSIQSGGSGCSGFDLPTDRQGYSSRSCFNLTKGQLRSLQQPVLMTTTAPTGTYDADILKALKTAIASSSSLVTLYDLSQALPTTPTTGTWQKTFQDLLNTISGLPAADRATILAQKPTDIASARGSAFLPPPIQVISGTSNETDLNLNTGGFYNSLQDGAGNPVGWMTMLQTNIKSLTYWNRDGIYVEATDSSLTTAFSAPASLTLGSGLSTNNLAFIKSAADSSATAGSFPQLGLAAADRTEGGLVLYATVDDTSGNIVTSTGTVPAAEQVPGKDVNGNAIAYVDKYRKYSGNIKRSPYGFVVSGGEELPAPLTIAADQAAYIQGDYNNPGVTAGSLSSGVLYRPNNTGTNNGAKRQPAAMIADTITVLSNECVNNNGRVGRVSSAATDTVNCGSSSVAIGSGQQVANGIAVNAAFLGNIMNSTGIAYSGGLNRHMRLLENWGTSTTGTYYNYTGSIVNLGQPLESGALAVGAGVPRRNFNFDNRFSSLNGLPPLTPSAVYLRQDVFKRSY